MTDQDKQKLEKLLLEEKRELEEKIKKLTDVDFGSDVGSDTMEEESDETEELAANIPLTNAFKERLGGIEEALEKIEKGTYGVCEGCGKEISVNLLEIDPESKLCKSCKANG